MSPALDNAHFLEQLGSEDDVLEDLRSGALVRVGASFSAAATHPFQRDGFLRERGTGK